MFLRYILIPFSHLRLGLPRGLFPSCFLTKTLYTFLSSPICAKFPAHQILLDLICLIIFVDDKKYETPLCKTSLILLLLQHIKSKYSPNNYVLKHAQSILFLNMRDQVSHPHNTLCFVYFNIYIPRQQAGR
jgi:hypothetical protein